MFQRSYIHFLFKNREGTWAALAFAKTSEIVTGDAPVSYGPNFFAVPSSRPKKFTRLTLLFSFLKWRTVRKERNLTSPSLTSMTFPNVTGLSSLTSLFCLKWTAVVYTNSFKCSSCHRHHGLGMGAILKVCFCGETTSTFSTNLGKVLHCNPETIS